MSRRGRQPLLDEVKQAEILAVLASGCNRQSAADYVGCYVKTNLISSIGQMMVEAVPVARYRKQMIARLGKLLDGAPEQIEKRSRCGKKSAPKTAVFPRNSPSRALPPPEKPKNRREKPAGTIRQTANIP